MNRVRTLAILPAVMLLSCATTQQGTPQGQRANYQVYHLPQAPRVDGEVRNDPAWAFIPAVSGFRVLGGDYAVAKQTTAKVGWTSDALFIAVDCDEPDIALIHDTLKDGDELWKDNGVEIFLEVPGRAGVYQFVVNSIGSHAMGEGTVDVAAWQAAAVKGKDFWSMEARIPFSCLGAPPAPGTAWTGAICRNIWEYASGGDKFTTWPSLQHRFREPGNFATLVFEDKTLPAEEAAQITLRLNLPYRQYLSQQVEDLARSAPEYEGVIAKACADDRFKTEAADLRQTWGQVGDLSRNSAQASLPEMRKFVAQANDLKRRSYELKYRFLIEELLRN